MTIKTISSVKSINYDISIRCIMIEDVYGHYHLVGSDCPIRYGPLEGTSDKIVLNKGQNL